MINYVIINGVNSNTINGLGINELPPISKPPMRVLTETIDGRDGDITTDLGYNAYDKTFTIGLFGTGYDINNIIAFFNNEGTIVFSNEPDKYYKYKIIEQIDYEKLLEFKTASVRLHCQPFKYPLEEEPLEIEYEYVNGEGETITLDNTEEDIKMSIDPKGNTSQDSTTGKNLLPITASSYSYGGITTILNEDGSISVSGTATGTSAYLMDTANVNLPAGTYTLSIGNIAPKDIRIFITDGTMTIYSGNTETNATTTQTITTCRLLMFTTQGETYNFTIKPMLESGSSATSFEPFTNGASPNPDYPQEIHSVTGDNEIVICGKNLFDKDNANILNAYVNASGTITSENSNRGIYLKVEKNTDYAMSMTQIAKSTATSADDVQVGLYESKPTLGLAGNRVYVKTRSSATQNYYFSTTFNTGNNEYVFIKVANTSRTELDDTLATLQLEKGNQVTDFEPYTGQIFPLYLGGTNLLDLNRTLGQPSNTAFTNTTKRTFNYNEYVVGMTTNNYYANDNKSSSISNNQVKYTSNDANYGIAFPVKVEPSTEYTFTADTNKGNSNYVRAIFYQSDGTYISDVRSSGTANYLTFTTPSNCDFMLCSLYANANEETTYSNIQLEKGSSSSPYRPYATPIELNAMGNYKDGFARNNGKNLLNPTDFINAWVSSATGDINNDNTNFLSNYIEVDKDKTYYLAAKVSFYKLSFVYYDADKTYLSKQNNSGGYVSVTPTIPNNAKYVRLEINYNNSATMTSKIITDNLVRFTIGNEPYEPYGSGLLCKYNAMEKVILNGTEPNWSKHSSSTGTNYRYWLSYANFQNIFRQCLVADETVLKDLALCNEFKGVIFSNTSYGKFSMHNLTDANCSFLVNLDNTDITTTEEFRTWLSSNNAEVLFPVQKPYLTLIEDETLIEQYNALENALSEKGQTNILQNNNDLPFYLIASAMKENSNEVIVNNIGNIYAKPTLDIEGSGIINIYKDNNQILQLNMDDTNEIVFEDMNAFDPATNELKNRKVTGNYNNVTIPSGESIIKADGNLTKMTITNYTRWL